LIGEEAEHLALFLALHQVVLVLHGDEPGPPMEVGHILHLENCHAHIDEPPM
jgi:hypothetical protein